MLLVDRRIKGIPVTFLAVLVVTILLTIFFGAWAVSADAESRDRNLALAIAGTGANFGGITTEAAEATDTKTPTNQEGEGAADTWWGKVLLKSCPLH